MQDKQQIDIAIIGAMTQEVEALLPYLTDCVKYQAIHSTYYIGKLYQRTVIIFQSGIGKVSAAVATAFVLERFGARCVINIGSAGGFDPRLAVGDIVISSEVAYHDVDVTLCGCAYGQIPNMPAVFKADESLAALAQHCAEQMTGHKVLQGLICSGDFFMSDNQAIAFTKQHFPQIIAADMEAAAIAHSCYLYQQPFVVIRAISDVVAQETNKVDFFEFLPIAAKKSADIVADMIRRLT